MISRRALMLGGACLFVTEGALSSFFGLDGRARQDAAFNQRVGLPRAHRCQSVRLGVCSQCSRNLRSPEANDATELNAIICS